MADFPKRPYNSVPGGRLLGASFQRKLVPSTALLPEQGRTSPSSSTTFRNVGSNPCSRCGGRGYLSQYRHVQGGVCFKCWGRGLKIEIPRAVLSTCPRDKSAEEGVAPKLESLAATKVTDLCDIDGPKFNFSCVVKRNGVDWIAFLLCPESRTEAEEKMKRLIIQLSASNKPKYKGCDWSTARLEKKLASTGKLDSKMQKYARHGKPRKIPIETAQSVHTYTRPSESKPLKLIGGKNARIKCHPDSLSIGSHWWTGKGG